MRTLKQIYHDIDNEEMEMSTRTLYRCSPKRWDGMTYKEALHDRVEKAYEAAMYYKSLADIADKHTDKYREYLELYSRSMKAREFNIDRITELLETENDIR